MLDWFNAAEDDLNTAGILFRQGVYYASAFYSPQSAGKALKAAHISESRKLGARHNIIALSSELGAPEDIKAACKRLNPHYVQSRYPDAANAIPAEAYAAEIAESLPEDAKKVFKWSGKKFQK